MVDVAVLVDETGFEVPTGVFGSAKLVVLMVAVEVVVVSAPSVLADGPVFLTSTAMISPVFALSAGTTGVLALALISSVAAVIGDFAAVVAAGAAWVVLGATSSAEAIVVPVKTVTKTTDAKVKVCLREIVYFFKIRPLFNKLFSIIQVFEKLVNGIIIKGLRAFYISSY